MFAKPECDNVLQPEPFRLIMFAKPECDNVLQPKPFRQAVQSATLNHTQAWQTLIHGNECFILLLIK